MEMDKNLFEKLEPEDCENSLQMMALAGYGPMMTFKGACDKAKKAGKQVVVSQPTLLMIDIDSDAAYKEFLTRLSMVEDHIELLDKDERMVQMVTSFSGDGHKHIYIRMRRGMTVWERCAMQLFLCSDPVKEMLSLMLEKAGDAHPILFFEKPEFTLDI